MSKVRSNRLDCWRAGASGGVRKPRDTAKLSIAPSRVTQGSGSRGAERQIDPSHVTTAAGQRAQTAISASRVTISA